MNILFPSWLWPSSRSIWSSSVVLLHWLMTVLLVNTVYGTPKRQQHSDRTSETITSANTKETNRLLNISLSNGLDRMLWLMFRIFTGVFCTKEVTQHVWVFCVFHVLFCDSFLLNVLFMWLEPLWTSILLKVWASGPSDSAFRTFFIHLISAFLYFRLRTQDYRLNEPRQTIVPGLSGDPSLSWSWACSAASGSDVQRLDVGDDTSDWDSVSQWCERGFALLFSSSGLHISCFSFLWKLDSDVHTELLCVHHEAEVAFGPWFTLRLSLNIHF